MLFVLRERGSHVIETSLKLTMLWFIIRELLILLLELQMHTTRSYFVWFWNGTLSLRAC